MPRTNADGKQPSGAQNRKARAAAARELAKARRLPPELLASPPQDDLQLQLWGARCAAVLAHVVLTQPDLLSREQLAQVQRYLATLGLLFPRSEMVARLERARKQREQKQETKEVEPRGDLPPGPASRRRRGGGGASGP